MWVVVIGNCTFLGFNPNTPSDVSISYFCRDCALADESGRACQRRHIGSRVSCAPHRRRSAHRGSGTRDDGSGDDPDPAAAALRRSPPGGRP